MNKNLSQIVAELFVISNGGEDLSSKTRRLRDEIKKVIESEDAIFGKFRGFLESFREIIPEEKQRYHAAIKALSTTSKLSQQEIIKAVNDQLEELKIIEKSLMPTLPGRDELNVMEAKSKEMKDEIAKLRDRIAWLESEEAGIRKGMAAREKDMELAEKTVKELFADIGVEITSVKKKLEEFTAESAAVQPVPQKASLISDVPSEPKKGEQKIEIQVSSAPPDTEFQKKCPMCGGRINFHALDKMWICYSCAYEESESDDARGKSNEKSEHTQNFAVSLAERSSNEYQEPKKESSPSKKQPSTRTKTCPSCRKKMYWFPEEKAWRCPSCHYETRVLR